MRNALAQSGCDCKEAHPLNTDWSCFETRAALICELLDICMSSEEFDDNICSPGQRASPGLILGVLALVAAQAVQAAFAGELG
jgi:hypothetical protein